MRRALKIPQARFPAPEQKLGRPFLISLAVHLAFVALLIWRIEAGIALAANQADQQSGGGGGGGGRQVMLVALPPVSSAHQTSVKQVETQPKPPVVPVFSPTVREIVPPPEEVTVRTSLPTLQMAKAPGTGDGINGGAGSGTGTGGGHGSGQGTGTGSGVGPGSGDGRGDVLPPSVRFSALPPMENRPASLRGKSFRVLFTVDPEGRVMEVQTEPTIDEPGYRRKFLDAMKRYRFNPATRDGTAVVGMATVTVTL